MTKDIIRLVLNLIVTFIFMIEHWCGLELAFEGMCIWAIISLITLIHILVKQVEIRVVEE